MFKIVLPSWLCVFGTELPAALHSCLCQQSFYSYLAQSPLSNIPAILSPAPPPRSSAIIPPEPHSCHVPNVQPPVSRFLQPHIVNIYKWFAQPGSLASNGINEGRALGGLRNIMGLCLTLSLTPKNTQIKYPLFLLQFFFIRVAEH